MPLKGNSRFDKILSLVGKQPIPVLIPILQYNPGGGAWLITTEETSRRAGHIRDAARDSGKCDLLPREAEPVPAYCSAKTCSQIKKLFESSVKQGFADPTRIAVNITGGTSIMALSASRAARSLGLPMLYVNTDENIIHHLTPDGSLDHKEDILLRISAQTYFMAHGVDQKHGPWGQAVREDKPWIRTFIEVAGELGRAGSRSAAMMDAIRQAYQPGQPYAVVCFSETSSELAKMLLSKGMIARVDSAEGKMVLSLVEHPGEEGRQKRKFLEGDWLELFVYGALRDSGLFDEVLYDVKISHNVNKVAVPNQLDVVAMRRSRLAAISCKSEPMDRQDKKGPLYELDSLLQADLMGLYSVKILVTNQPEFSDTLKARAELSGIHLVTGKQFPDIVERVEKALKKTI
jgi:hypothetical protein